MVTKVAQAFYRDLLATRRDAGLELCPTGTYDVKVIGADVKVNENSGRKSFIVEYEITTGPLTGRKVKNWMTIVSEYPGLVDMWFKDMASMGLTDAFFEAEPEDKQICDALKGRTCQIAVGRRKKNKTSDEEMEDIKVRPSALAAPPVAAPAPDPMAAPMGGPAADPNAPGLPPF
jgi:hypothetical protein